jgi:60 kDa SS-A/Ro ribonucleoprotein
MRYQEHVSQKVTSQQEEVFGKSQVKNNAGGFVFKIDDQALLNRFLILGTEKGSYYAGERKMTQDAAKTIIEMIKHNGEAVVQFVVQVSDAGRAPKNDPAIFVLALCATYGDENTKKAAYASIPQVCRIGTHIFQFCDAVVAMRGWSAGLRRGVSKFYTNKTEDQVALQLIKYRQRGGWTHRDVLRLAHPSATGVMNDMFRWSVGKEVENQLHPMIEAFIRLQETQSAKEVISLVRDNRLPWEALPTEWLKESKVWEALMENIPMGAMVRNLGRLSALGLTGPLSDATQRITKLLGDQEAIKKARLHPLNLLVALKTYEQGHGDKGSLTWSANPKIVSALDEAFYLSFGTVEPMGKKTLSALDVSGSMGWGNIAGLPLTPAQASAAMAMLRVRVEEQHHTMGFSTRLVDIPLTKQMSLDAVTKRIAGISMGGTDCSLPMVWAQKNKIPVEVFEVYTDNETWAGAIHPFQALKSYRNAMGIPAKLVVYGMTATEFSIADPSDGGMLDVVGFDTAAPAVVTAFAKG